LRHHILRQEKTGESRGESIFERNTIDWRSEEYKGRFWTSLTAKIDNKRQQKPANRL